MTRERIEQHSIFSLGRLAKGLVEGGVSEKIASEFVWHEGAHALEDEIGFGEFGFVITWEDGKGQIMAYYHPLGEERTFKQKMKIAAAPGFSEMSRWDLFLYRMYEAQLFKEEWRKKHKAEDLSAEEPSRKRDQEDVNQKSFDQLVEEIVYPVILEKPEQIREGVDIDCSKRLNQLFRDKVKKLRLEGYLPDFRKISDGNFSELAVSYAPVLRKAFEETIQEIGLEDTKMAIEEEKNKGKETTSDYEEDEEQAEYQQKDTSGDIYVASEA